MVNNNNKCWNYSLGFVIIVFFFLILTKTIYTLCCSWEILEKEIKLWKKKIIFLYLDNIENDIEKMRIRKQALQKHFQQNKKINKNQKIKTKMKFVLRSYQ